MTILPATIVAFYNLRELTYAWVNSVDGSYCKLVTEHNEAVSLCDSRFIWVGRETWLADDTLKLLSDFRRDVDAFQGEIANCDFSCLKNNELSLEAIAEVLLLNTDVQQAALYTYIKNHPANFTSKKGKFRLKTDQEQQACIADAREKEKRSEYLQAVQDFPDSGDQKL